MLFDDMLYDLIFVLHLTRLSKKKFCIINMIYSSNDIIAHQLFDSATPIASTGPLLCDVAKRFYPLLTLNLLSSQSNPAAINLFLNWLFGPFHHKCSLLILQSWGFTIFCKISMKTIIESLQWCKSLDITTADSHKSLCQKHEEKIVICFLFQWVVCASFCQKMEKCSEKSICKTPTESVSLASFKFCT